MKQPHEMRPGNRYAKERGEGRTLGELARAKMALVAVCPRCKHRRVLYPGGPHRAVWRGISCHQSSAAPALHGLPSPQPQPAQIRALEHVVCNDDLRATQAIITITNRERRQRNLPPLKVDRACTLAITGHVHDMARARYLSHQGRDGRGASERYRRYKPAGRGAGENVAYNTYGTGESFMRQWLRSPGHRENILSPVYKGIVVSVQANCSSRGAGGRCYYYAGQCFSP